MELVDEYKMDYDEDGYISHPEDPSMRQDDDGEIPPPDDDIPTPIDDRSDWKSEFFESGIFST